MAPRRAERRAARAGIFRFIAILPLLAGAAGCASAPHRPSVSSTSFTKPVSFSILEDYDKGEDLAEVARDFELMRELGVRTWRGSFGWDDYEPERSRYDFAWLRRFVELAGRYGIELRPYLGYTAPWAAVGREADGQTWNDPPARLDDWYAFVHRVASELRDYPNVRSYEIYNEENVKLWWDGTVEEYGRVLERGAAAIRAADPDAEVLLGGMVWPDVDWLEASCAAQPSNVALDIIPFHAYPETWTPDSVTVESYLDASYRTDFLETVDRECGGKPVWINETGFATVPGRTERQQANWWARAIATFLADRRVEHIGIYEVKDLRPERDVIGDAPNYYLGLTRHDRSRKLAFATVRRLVELFDVQRLTVADGELSVRLVGGEAGDLHHHLFVRPNGEQVLLVWDRTGHPTLDLRLTRRGRAVTEYALDGAPSPRRGFDGHTLHSVELVPGEVRIFRISPDR